MQQEGVEVNGVLPVKLARAVVRGVEVGVFRGLSLEHVGRIDSVFAVARASAGDGNAGSVECATFSAPLRVKGQEYALKTMAKPLDRKLVGRPFEGTRCTANDGMVNESELSWEVDHPTLQRIKGLPARWVLFETSQSDQTIVYLNSKWDRPLEGTPKQVKQLFLTGK